LSARGWTPLVEARPRILSKVVRDVLFGFLIFLSALSLLFQIPCPHYVRSVICFGPSSAFQCSHYFPAGGLFFWQPYFFLVQHQTLPVPGILFFLLRFLYAEEPFVRSDSERKLSPRSLRELRGLTPSHRTTRQSVFYRFFLSSPCLKVSLTCRFDFLLRHHHAIQCG